MVEHQSKEVVDKMSEDLKIQPALALPKQIANNIQPVYNVNPDIKLLVKRAVGADTGGFTIHIADTKKRTFLVGGQISVAKDAINDATSSFMQVVLEETGATERLLERRYQPLTAESFDIKTILPYPIEIKKGSAITANNSAATASIDLVGIVYYYEVDTQ